MSLFNIIYPFVFLGEVLLTTFLNAFVCCSGDFIGFLVCFVLPLSVVSAISSWVLLRGAEYAL